MARAIITLAVMYVAGFAGGFVTKTFVSKTDTKTPFMNGCMNGAGLILNMVGLTANAQGVDAIAKACEQQGKQQHVWQ